MKPLASLLACSLALSSLSATPFANGNEDEPLLGLPLRESLYTLDASSMRVFRLGPSQTEKRTVGYFPMGPCGSVALGPDGMLYTIFLNDKQLFRMDPADGSTEILGALKLKGTLWEGGLTISPGGQAYGCNLAKSTFGGTTTWLYSVDLQTGKGTLIGDMGNYEINGLAWRDDGKLIGVDRWSNMFVRVNPINGNTSKRGALPVRGGGFGGVAITAHHGYFITAGANMTPPGTHELWRFDPYTFDTTRVSSLPAPFQSVGFNGLSPATLMHARTAAPQSISFDEGTKNITRALLHTASRLARAGGLLFAR